MALPGSGRSSSVLLSLTFQLLLALTSVYFVFYLLFTFGLIITKSLSLSYPADALASDVSVLFLLAVVGSVQYFCGAKGNLTERSDYILANVLVTVISVLLVIYFLTYQTYVMRADVITSSILIVAYGVDGLVALSMLTRLVRSVLHSSLCHNELSL
ncbi:hypothetical protein fugu_011482 [Takifugu bimaculatus]|uniref:Transmembrane protein 80 n=1 Tax=Takifugu bimaculatus TaxID=433685 RepID=A0A4Z2C7S0_9TELE|nr:hypothetical protein fugu_011482 [Takifugu bimaculatus]